VKSTEYLQRLEGLIPLGCVQITHKVVVRESRVVKVRESRKCRRADRQTDDRGEWLFLEVFCKIIKKRKKRKKNSKDQRE
jgi:hypothetical protein